MLRTRDSVPGPGSRAPLLPPPGDAGGELGEVLPGEAGAVRGALSRLAVLGTLVPAGALPHLLRRLADLEKYVNAIKLPNIARKTSVIVCLSLLNRFENKKWTGNCEGKIRYYIIISSFFCQTHSQTCIVENRGEAN